MLLLLLLLLPVLPCARLPEPMLEGSTALLQVLALANAEPSLPEVV